MAGSLLRGQPLRVVADPDRSVRFAVSRAVDLAGRLRRRSAPAVDFSCGPVLADLESGSAERVLRQVVSWLLPGGGDIDVLADEAQAQILVAKASSARVLGPLLVAFDAGALHLPAALVEEALLRHQDMLVWCMQVEERLLEVADWFARAGGVEFLVIKGPAVAHLDDPDPSLRSFSDLDLLVRSRDMDRALSALVDHHAVRRLPQRRPGFDRRFIKSVGLKCPDGVELDIHRTLCTGALGLRIPLDDVFTQPDTFVVGGARFGAPKASHRALHAAYHAMLGTTVPQLRTLRDLAGYLTNPDLAPHILVPEARRWQGETVLAGAVRATLDTLSFEAPAWREWLDGFEPDERELGLIERSRAVSPWPIDLPMFVELGWRDRLAFTWAVAVPSRETIQHRGVSPVDRLVQGVRQIGRSLQDPAPPR